MSKKYDGWALKVGKYVRADTVHYTRRRVIDDFEKIMGDWRSYRRNGLHKIVRVKITEAKP